MSEVIVVVVLQAKPGSGTAVSERLRATADATHAEPGCTTYALHAAKGDPDQFALVERWASQEALDAHLQQPHVVELFAALEDLLTVPPTVAFTQPLPAGDPVKGSLARSAG